MKKFHVVDGIPKECKANKRDCPVGGKHYTSEKEAYESIYSKKLFPKILKSTLKQ